VYAARSGQHAAQRELAMNAKPTLSFWQIWNMSFGFLGIQFGFALQNANMSRIFQTLGAEMDQLAILWLAAPLTGLLVQPIIGYASDRTWTRLGRRRPYFLFGALATSAALIVMPNSQVLWVAAGMLWILDASINVSMEPFRAYVADQLPPKQRASGFAMQSFFIGIGAVVASMLPWLLAHAGVANTADAGQIPDTVRYAFYVGALVLFLAVGWTVVSTREYPPEVLHGFDDATPADTGQVTGKQPAPRIATIWLAGGIIFALLVHAGGWARELYVLAGMATAYGLALLRLTRSRADNAFTRIMGDLHDMPPAMRQLAVVQFFSWFALFSMWLYTTATVTSLHYGTTDPTSAAFNDGANWVGVLFAAYNGFAALAAAIIPLMVRRMGLRLSHLLNLWLGAAGLASIILIRDPTWLLASMIGIGFAWASILSLPYAMLSGSLPSRKMGVYMGIFNFFIVIPQLVAVSVLGVLLRHVFANEPVYILLLGATSFVIAGLCVLRVGEQQPRLALHAP
jgi:maltose/moltooligosaccharide transporter